MPSQVDYRAIASSLTSREWAELLAGERHTTAPIPQPPDRALQELFVGSSGAAAYTEAEIFIDTLSEFYPISAETKVLDIGVGWGRMLRWMLRYVAPENMIGLDVDPKAVSLCAAALPDVRFETVREPPYQFIKPASIDVAILYSLFSHLIEPAAVDILTELARVVRPGGAVALTTLVVDHIDVWARNSERDQWNNLLTAVDFDADTWRRRAEQGQALFVPTGGGDPSRPSTIYGEAILSKRWFAIATEPDFELLSFTRPPNFPQAIVVLQRK